MKYVYTGHVDKRYGVIATYWNKSKTNEKETSHSEPVELIWTLNQYMPISLYKINNNRTRRNVNDTDNLQLKYIINNHK